MDKNFQPKNIPDGWRQAQLSNVAKINMGQSPSSTAYNEAGDGLPLIQGNNDIVDGLTVSRIWTSEITKVAEKGQIILTVRAPVGAVGVAHTKVCIGRGVCALDADSKGFIWHYLKYFEPKWGSLEQGSTFTAVNSADIKKINLSLPPLPEQNRIVAVLETWDKAIEKLARKIEVKKNIKTGLMQELLTGKTRLPGFTDKWEMVKLGDVCKFQNGYPFESSNFSDNAGVRIIRNRDLKGNSQILFFSGSSIPSDYLVDDGDVLVGMDGDFVACRWSQGRALLNQRVGRLKNFKGSVRDFLYHKIQIPLKIIEQETSSTTVKHLSSATFEKFKTLLPRREEQIAIVEVLNVSEREIEQLQQKLLLLQGQKKYLLNNLITGAIRTPEKMKIHS